MKTTSVGQEYVVGTSLLISVTSKLMLLYNPRMQQNSHGQWMMVKMWEPLASNTASR